MVPAFEQLVANMPSGREIHSSQPFLKPMLDDATLARMRAPPEGSTADNVQDMDSSDDEEAAKSSSAIPGTFQDSSAQSTGPYY